MPSHLTVLPDGTCISKQKNANLAKFWCLASLKDVGKINGKFVYFTEI
jgi:hypothetical protein